MEALEQGVQVLLGLGLLEWEAGKGLEGEGLGQEGAVHSEALSSSSRLQLMGR